MQVTKIIEGGIDLTTGKELDVGITVSNGIRELMIPIDMATLQILTVMVTEANLLDNPTPRKGIGMVPEDLNKRPPENLQGMPQLVSVDGPPPTPPENFEADSEPDEIEDEEGFMAGEEYDDTGTGVSSL